MHLAVLLLLLSTPAPGEDARFPKGLGPTALGTPPSGFAWRTEDCIRCHPAQGEAWRHSGHAQARSSFVFQAALAVESPQWCVRCHAPLARDTRHGVPAEGGADERGVGCPACHATEGSVLGMAGGVGPHGSVRAELRSGAFCANCHQFGFPLREHGELVGLTTDGAPQQDTFEEWREWTRRSDDGRSCADCHMSRGDHAFGGVRRLESLREALEITVEPTALAVRNRGAGHSLPTGDVMRALTLEVAEDVLFEAPVTLARFERTLALDTQAKPMRQRVARDTALAAGELRRFPLPPGRFRYWRLVYHRVSLAQEEAGVLPPDVSAQVVAAGSLVSTGGVKR